MSRVFVALIVAAVLALVGGCGYAVHQTSIKKGAETITVEGKERIAENQDGKWVVYGADGQTFEVSDSLFYLRFDATDRYREIEVGRTYECETVGVRWNLLSTYKNLLDCEAVDG